MTDNRTLLTAARAEALFTSDLSAAEQPTRAQVTVAIRHAVTAHGGTRGCAGEVAAAYGNCPETAVHRMRWSRSVVERVYSRRRSPDGDAPMPSENAGDTATPPATEHTSPAMQVRRLRHKSCIA